MGSAGLPREPDGGGVAACTGAVDEVCGVDVLPVPVLVAAGAVPEARALARSRDC